MSLTAYAASLLQNLSPETLRREWPGNVRGDLIAGVVVALALIPEAIAFSLIAGVASAVGLYASFSIAIMTSIFGGRPGMISAATGAMALLVATHGVEYLFAATILTGVLQLAFRTFRLSRYTRFVPHSVMTGFVNALAVLIFMAQLPHLIGGNVLIYALVASGLLIIYGLPRLTTAIPSPLVAIVLLTAITLGFGFNAHTVGDMGPMPTTLPLFHLPMVPLSLETLKITAPFSIAMVLVGLIESLLASAVVLTPDLSIGVLVGVLLSAVFFARSVSKLITATGAGVALRAPGRGGCPGAGSRPGGSSACRVAVVVPQRNACYLSGAVRRRALSLETPVMPLSLAASSAPLSPGRRRRGRRRALLAPVAVISVLAAACADEAPAVEDDGDLGRVVTVVRGQDAEPVMVAVGDRSAEPAEPARRPATAEALELRLDPPVVGAAAGAFSANLESVWFDGECAGEGRTTSAGIRLNLTGTIRHDLPDLAHVANAHALLYARFSADAIYLLRSDATALSPAVHADAPWEPGESRRFQLRSAPLDPIYCRYRPEQLVGAVELSVRTPLGPLAETTVISQPLSWSMLDGMASDQSAVVRRALALDSPYQRARLNEGQQVDVLWIRRETAVVSTADGAVGTMPLSALTWDTSTASGPRERALDAVAELTTAAGSWQIRGVYPTDGDDNGWRVQLVVHNGTDRLWRCQPQTLAVLGSDGSHRALVPTEQLVEACHAGVEAGEGTSGDAAFTLAEGVRPIAVGVLRTGPALPLQP